MIATMLAFSIRSSSNVKNGYPFKLTSLQNNMSQVTCTGKICHIEIYVDSCEQLLGVSVPYRLTRTINMHSKDIKYLVVYSKAPLAYISNGCTLV